MVDPAFLFLTVFLDGFSPLDNSNKLAIYILTAYLTG